MKALRALTAMLLISAVPAATAPSFPIDPASLLQLYGDATVIVVAEVDPCGEHVSDRDSFWEACAQLYPQETLKGSVPREPLHVRHAPGMICPAPARYSPGERVLAFLRWEPEKEAFFTCSLSYGTKYPDDDGLAAYRERINEVAAILEVENADLRLEQTVEWLVKCAEHEATLDEAVIEFRRWRPSDSKEPDFGAALTVAQCRRLAAVIARAAEGRELPYWPAPLMSAVAKALDDGVLRSLVDGYERTSSVTKRRRILTAFAASVAKRGD
jgi:hypothetical protein